MSDFSTRREDALAAQMTRRNLADATERAIKCLEAANVGLHRLTSLQFTRYPGAKTALYLLQRALKFGQ